MFNDLVAQDQVKGLIKLFALRIQLSKAGFGYVLCSQGERLGRDVHPEQCEMRHRVRKSGKVVAGTAPYVQNSSYIEACDQFQQCCTLMTMYRSIALLIAPRSRPQAIIRFQTQRFDLPFPE